MQKYLNRNRIRAIVSSAIVIAMLLPQLSFLTSALGLDRLTFTYSADDVDVTASVSREAVFTAQGEEVSAGDVELYAEALNPDDKRFSALDTDSSQALMFDVSFRTQDGAQVEVVDCDAKLNYSLPEQTHAGDITELQVFQYVPEDNSGEVQQANGVQLKEGDNSVSFLTEGFSSYAVIYTVDYEYNGEIFQMPGNSAALLSELFERLEIVHSVDEVATVSFSDDSLLSVSHVSGVFCVNDTVFDAGEGDWLLVSHGTFHTVERLTVELIDGTLLKIKVTDPEYTTDLSRLNSEMMFIINGEIVDQEYEGDTVFVRDNMLYDYILSFEETDELQFSDDQPLVFTLPSAFRLPNDFSDTLDMSLGRYGKLKDNPVTYNSADNTISITWNTDDAIQYSRLISSKSARFTLSLKGYFNLQDGATLFDSGKSIALVRENPRNAAVRKEGIYNPSNNTITYIVTVISDGTTEDLIVTDEMGSALVYAGDCRFLDESSVNTAGTTPLITNKGSTFEISIPDLNHGDKLEFMYTCLVDVSKIGHSGNATFEETGNTVKVAGDQDPTDNVATYWENEIYFSDIEKDSINIGAQYKLNGNNYRDVSWQVITNRGAIVNFAGSDITDTIGLDVQQMCSYSGDGVTVRCYDTGHNLKATRVIPWSELGVTSDNHKSFTYQIPEDDPPYCYQLDYKTKVDMSKIYNQITLTNNVVGKGGEDDAFAVVRPPGDGGLDVQKNHVNVTSDHVTWQIILTIGKNYDSDTFVLTEHSNNKSNSSVPWERDGLPGKWFKDRIYREDLEKVEVLGLYEGESFDVIYNNRTYNPSDHKTVDQGFIHNSSIHSANTFKMNFYKDNAHSTTGLQKTKNDEEYRVITVNITDSFPVEWAQAAKRYIIDNNYTSHGYFEHVNWVDVNNVYNGDKIAPRPIGVFKRVLRNNTPTYNMVNNGKVYPVFYYQALVSGVSTDDPLVIDDTFDTELFKLYEPRSGRQMSENDWNGSKVPNSWDNWYTTDFGGLDNFDWLAASRGPYFKVGAYGASQETTDKGVRFTLPEIPKKENGDYYAYYGVQYWVTAKDETALAKIEKLAYESGGVGTFYNTASCRGESSTAQVSITTKNHLVPLDKNSVVDEENNKVSYTIEVNAGKLEMNDGEPYSVIDTYSRNLVLDFKTINIVCDPPENVVQVSYDFSNYRGEFKVPDNTHVTITYDANILVEHGDVVTPITNTVSALSYEKVQHDDVTLTTSSHGEADIPGLYVFKFGSGHMEKGLNGAVFQLYRFEEQEQGGTTVTVPVMMYYPDNAITRRNGTAGQPITFTTQTLNGRDGFVDVTLAQELDGVQLEFDKRYGLEEIVTPTSTAMNGETIEYKMPTFTYLFTICNEDEQPDYSQYKFMLGDVMTVRNTPKAIGIDIRKKIDGNCADELTQADLNNLTFTILRKTGSNPDTWGNIMTEVDISGQHISVINPNFVDIPYSDFVNGFFEISGLTVDDSAEAGIYKIVESGNDAIQAAHPSWNIETAYRWGDSNSHSDIVTITADDVSTGEDKEVWITNSYNKDTVKLTAEKKWLNTRGAAMAWPGMTSVVFDLYTVDANVLSSAPVRSITLDGIADNNGEDISGKAMFSDLPKNDDNDNPITYVVKERAPVSGYTTTYSGSHDDYAEFSNKTAVITNRQQHTSVTVTKRWQNTVDDFSPPANARVTLRLFSRVVGAPESTATRVPTEDDVVLTADDSNSWTAFFDYLPLVNGRGEAVEYLVKEISCTPESYEADYVSGSYAKNGESIINHPALTDFKVTKEWTGTDGNDWPDEVSQIELNLLRKTADGTVDSGFRKICTLTKATGAYTGDVPLNWKGESPAFIWTKTGNKYNLTAEGLDKYGANGEWIYYVTEVMPAGVRDSYSALYADKNRSLIDGGYATNAGYITNIRTVRDLHISKNVTGNMGDRFRDFSFTVKLQKPGNASITQIQCIKASGDGETVSDTVLRSVNGSFTITLAHGQTATFKDLPGGVTYTVTESNYASEGYATTVSSDGDEAVTTHGASGNMSSEHKVLFTNIKHVLITTGLSLKEMIAIASVVLLISCAVCILLIRKRRCSNEDAE